MLLVCREIEAGDRRRAVDPHGKGKANKIDELRVREQVVRSSIAEIERNHEQSITRNKNSSPLCVACQHCINTESQSDTPYGLRSKAS